MSLGHVNLKVQAAPLWVYEPICSLGFPLLDPKLILPHEVTLSEVDPQPWIWRIRVFYHIKVIFKKKLLVEHTKEAPIYFSDIYEGDLLV